MSDASEKGRGRGAGANAVVALVARIDGVTAGSLKLSKLQSKFKSKVVFNCVVLFIELIKLWSISVYLRLDYCLCRFFT